MKKIALTILAGATALALGACNSDATDEAATEASPAAEESPMAEATDATAEATDAAEASPEATGSPAM